MRKLICILLILCIATPAFSSEIDWPAITMIGLGIFGIAVGGMMYFGSHLYEPNSYAGTAFMISGALVTMIGISFKIGF